MFSKEVVLKGKNHGRSFAMDINWLETGAKKPLIMFIHGFKGFKDWGTFPEIARNFAQRGYVFAKVNMSHNGVTPDSPIDFVDLNAFSENTFTTELEDIDQAVSFLLSNENPVPEGEIERDSLAIIGHSRGGAMAYIFSSNDSRVRAVSGWAAICDLENRWPESMLMDWKEKGIYHLPNSRTGQLMPLKYSIVEDYLEHQGVYHIPTALRNLSIPALHVHGDNDETVYIQEAKMVLKNIKHVNFNVIKGANHVFGGSHPFASEDLPEQTLELIQQTDQFLKG